jgi:NodT family efflux transporter outer membrane factor (OMF) lipoprotein
MAVIVLLCGCAPVGPEYRQPTLDSPGRWANSADTGPQTVDGAQTTWWQSFDDPLLNSLIDRAVDVNLGLEQAKARIAQARAGVVVAGAPGLPQINAAGNITRSRRSGNLTTSGSGQTSTLYQAGFDTGWELDLFGGVRRSVESAQARLEGSIEELHGATLTLLGDVARNYIELRARQAQLQITRNNLATQQDTVALTQDRYRLGLTSYLDVTQAEAQRTATESNIPPLEAAIKTSMHRLAILVAQPPAALTAELTPVRPLPAIKGLLAPGLPAELLARRPDLRAAERQLAAASADIGVATAELYPTFDLTLGLGLQSSSSSSFIERASRYWSIIPGVTLPLYDGGKRRATIQAKQAVYDESLARYRAAYNTALEEVENGLAAYYAERDRNRVLSESVRINEESVALALDRYRRGLTTFLDVLIAQRTLYTAQSNLTESNSMQLINLIALHKALGGGWQVSAQKRQ